MLSVIFKGIHILLALQHHLMRYHLVSIDQKKEEQVSLFVYVFHPLLI